MSASMKNRTLRTVLGPVRFDNALKREAEAAALEEQRLRLAAELEEQRLKLEAARENIRNTLPLWRQYQELYRVEFIENINPKAAYKDLVDYNSMKTERWTAIRVIYQNDVVLKYAVNQLEGFELTPFMVINESPQRPCASHGSEKANQKSPTSYSNPKCHWMFQ
ncbi:hypothetical protein HDV02_004818 [Globomyces sp. JEL0801]|nr:hypothetical protein HDV02_004818 [Globomyces sp. JEL0801]